MMNNIDFKFKLQFCHLLHFSAFHYDFLVKYEYAFVKTFLNSMNRNIIFLLLTFESKYMTKI